MKKVKNTILYKNITVGIIIIIIFVAITGFLVFRSHPFLLIQYHLNLGEKYLEELDYENALIQFDEVLSVEPHNLKALYGGLQARIELPYDNTDIASYFTNTVTFISGMQDDEIRNNWDLIKNIILSSISFDYRADDSFINLVNRVILLFPDDVELRRLANGLNEDDIQQDVSLPSNTITPEPRTVDPYHLNKDIDSSDLEYTLFGKSAYDWTLQKAEAYIASVSTLTSDYEDTRNYENTESGYTAQFHSDNGGCSDSRYSVRFSNNRGITVELRWNADQYEINHCFDTIDFFGMDIKQYLLMYSADLYDLLLQDYSEERKQGITFNNGFIRMLSPQNIRIYSSGECLSLWIDEETGIIMGCAFIG